VISVWSRSARTGRSSAGAGSEYPGGAQDAGQELMATDRVALEVTGSCWEVARILEPCVDR
jgi:hypothetical protein